MRWSVAVGLLTLVLAGCTPAADTPPTTSSAVAHSEDEAIVSRFTRVIWPPIADVARTGNFESTDTPAFDAIVSKDVSSFDVELLRVRVVGLGLLSQGGSDIVNVTGPDLVSVDVAERKPDSAVLDVCYSMTGDFPLGTGRQRSTAMATATFTLQKTGDWYLKDANSGALMPQEGFSTEKCPSAKA